MTHTESTFETYSTVRDQIEALAGAAATALHRAEQLDLDAADHLAVDEKLALAQGYLAAIRAA